MTFLRNLRSAAACTVRRTIFTTCVVLLASFAGPAQADIHAVRQKLAEQSHANKWPPFHPSTVTETVFPGLYRWQPETDTGVIFVNDAVTLLLYTDGRVITNWSQPVLNPQPISAAEKTEMLDQMVRSVRLDKLIRIRQGDGRNQVILLSAFDCPYCIKFERMLAGAGGKVNADIYIFPTTLNNKEVRNLSTVRNIWCDANNAEVWRNVLVKAAPGYFSAAYPGCPLGNHNTQDLEIILRSAGLKFGYPTMIFGNGIVNTAAQELGQFQAQLKAGEGRMWSDAHPEKYSQFRYVQKSVRPDSAAPRTLRELFNRVVAPSGSAKFPAE